MLERTLQRGGCAVVRGGHRERLDFLNGLLWGGGEAFLPHGIEGDPDPDRHPVWLTTGSDMPNGAQTLFAIDGASVPADEAASIQITALLFDGHDPAAVAAARDDWRRLTEAGLKAVYWAQDANGRWVKKHETG